MILLPKTFPVTRGIKQGRVLVPTLFAFYISALLLRAFPPTSGVCSTHSHVALGSCSSI